MERLFHSDYPIFSLCQVEPGQFLIGGGGGAAKCGIPNAIELYSVSLRRDENKENKNQGKYCAKLLCRKELEKEAMWHLERHPTDSKLVVGSLTSKSSLIFIGNLPTTEVSEGGLPVSVPVLDFKGEVKCAEDTRHKQARFSPKGDLLVTVTTENVMRLWTLPQMEPCGVLEGHKGEVSDLSFHPDGSKLVSTGDDHVIRIWVLETFSELFSLQWPPEVEGTEKTETFTCKNCRVTSRYDSKAKLTRSYIFTAHNKIGSRRRYSSIVQWDMSVGSIITSKKSGPHPICAVEVASDPDLLAVGNVEGQVAIYCTNSLKCLRVLQAHSVSITSMHFLTLPGNPASKEQPEPILLTASIDRTCCVTSCKFKDPKRWLYFIALPLLFLFLAYLIPTYLKPRFY